MSMELHVFLAKHKVPDIGQWQAAIDSLGFDVKLDPATNVATDSGFLPATINGRASGFEFDIGPADELREAYSGILAAVSGFDTTGNFRWGGRLDEMACAMAAAAALAAFSDGVWFDPQEGECRDAAGAVKEAQAGIAAACQ